MHKYPEFRVGVPLGKRMAIEGLESGLVSRGRLSRDRGKDKERSKYEQNASEIPVEMRNRHLAVPE
jgi:hypothetical protein